MPQTLSLRSPTPEARELRKKIYKLVKHSLETNPRRSAAQVVQLVIETYKLWYDLSKKDRNELLRFARTLKERESTKKIAQITVRKYAKLTLAKKKNKKSKNILNVQPIEIIDVFC